jgi:hypothetical protein
MVILHVPRTMPLLDEKMCALPGGNTGKPFLSVPNQPAAPAGAAARAPESGGAGFIFGPPLTTTNQ